MGHLFFHPYIIYTVIVVIFFVVLEIDHLLIQDTFVEVQGTTFLDPFKDISSRAMERSAFVAFYYKEIFH